MALQTYVLCDFAEVALFKRYGIICLPRGPSTLSAERRLTNGSEQD